MTSREHSGRVAQRRGWSGLAASLAVALILGPGCTSSPPAPAAEPERPGQLTPKTVTERVVHDTDDPAIWLHPTDPAQSLVIGTDKGVKDAGKDNEGSLYAFDLEGRVVGRVADLERPNNVDVEYGLILDGVPTDIAVVTERNVNSIRVFSLPELAPVYGGGIEVFVGETDRAPMGVAVYKRPSDGAVFAVVGRKTGPLQGYLWQYRLEDDGTGKVKATKVREFGAWSGEAEIEAIAVDDALGYVYYSDEAAGVRKYRADPDADDAAEELALFGTDGFTEDLEGISIYTIEDGTGYILVSDQQVNAFNVYPREGTENDPHEHPLVGRFDTSTIESDGSEVTSAVLGEAFPGGLFVAMSEGGTFHYYAWPDVAGSELAVTPGGRRTPPETETGDPSARP